MAQSLYAYFLSWFYILNSMFSDQFIRIHAHTCEVRAIRIHANTCKGRAERDQSHVSKVKWVLDYPYPCECTRVVIGGFTRGTPKRQYYHTPVYAESPLVSDDISEFRRHYGIECEEESKWSKWFLKVFFLW